VSKTLHGIRERLMKQAAKESVLVRAFIFGFVCLVLATGPTACSSGPQDSAAGAAPASGSRAPGDLLNPAQVEGWADETFGKILEEYRVSGLAISVTQGEELILNKGYGYADWVTKAPVDPDTSQFRIGSLSKTFLSTAVAQLLERGQIDSLDDPANKYLERIQLESPSGRDITVWDLLTHQGGLGSSPVFIPETDGPRPLAPLPADFVSANTPDVVREPGTISIYCNPCSATLGFMVEDITGQTLEDVFRENIYAPLDMTHTTLTNDPDPGPNMVTQYAFAPDGPPVALPYPAISAYISYAGDVNSTAGDMAKWLMSHIQEGSGTVPAILSPETFRLMHRRNRGNHPDMSGFGMNFFTYDYNGEPVLEHYGSIRFRSMEFMMLDRKIGVFVTMGGGGEPSDALLADADTTLPPTTGPVERAMSHSGVRALVLEYFLGPLPLHPDPDVDISQYTGLYRNIPTAAGAAPGPGGRTVEDSGDGGLVIGGLGVYRPSGPHTFTLDGILPLEAGFRDSNKYVFATGPDGVTRMFAHVNAGGFERVPE
jgi:CubicO group peptidase (beta-lactamase class C family)